MRTIIVILVLIFSNLFAQLKLVEKKSFNSETDIYLDNNGKTWADIIHVKFKGKALDLKAEQKKAQLKDVLITETKELLKQIEKKYGPFNLEKEFDGSCWGDTVGIHIVTKEKVKLNDLSQFFILKFKNPISFDNVKYDLMKSNRIEYVSEPYNYCDNYTPNDYNPTVQWALNKTDAAKAWDITQGSDQVKIALCESWEHWTNDSLNDYHQKNGGGCTGTESLNYLHNELANGKVFVNGANYSGGHGTEVASAAAALTDNNQGIASIGFKTKLMLFWSSPNGINWSRTYGAHIINCSWGNDSTDSPQLRSAIENALNEGRIVVSAAGNDTSTHPRLPCSSYPASYSFLNGKQVIAVSATGINENNVEQFADYPISNTTYNYSPGSNPLTDTLAFIDFAAPGVGVKVLHRDFIDQYQVVSGTSESSPFVAGLLALIRSIYEGLTLETALIILKNSVDKIDQSRHPDSYFSGGYGWNQYTGWGRVNAYKALKYTIEHYGGKFDQNVTLPAGDTWNLQPGVTLSFASGCALIVNGTLNAVGNSSNPIIFTRSGSSGTWSGIQFNSGSSGNIQYCNINEAYYGIRCDNASPTIANNNLNKTTGIQASGIYCQTGASPTINHNQVHGYSNGLYYINYCGGMTTNNLITSNSNGAIVYNCNGLYLGVAYMGYNNFSSNSNLELIAVYSNPVWAQNNYWGRSYDPKTSPSRIYEEYATVYSSPFLTSPPSFARIETTDITSPYSKQLVLSKSVDGNLSSDTDEELLEIQNRLNEKKYKEVISLSENSFNKTTNINSKKYLLGVLQTCFRNSDEGDFIDYLNKKVRVGLSKKSEEYASTIEVENIWLLSKGKTKEAIQNMEILIKDYPKFELIQKQNLFNLFHAYFFYMNDKETSEVYFNQLQKNYPDDQLIENCLALMGGSTSFQNNEREISIKKDIEGSQSLEFGLDENYPNPFNPTTTIKFSIPEQVDVKLKVFDILGREVKVLLDKYMQAGTYEIEFNASELPSGVYFYNLVAGSKSITKKMVLTK